METAIHEHILGDIVVEYEVNGYHVAQTREEPGGSPEVTVTGAHWDDTSKALPETVLDALGDELHETCVQSIIEEG
jgi:hypothetical protein